MISKLLPTVSIDPEKSGTEKGGNQSVRGDKSTSQRPVEMFELVAQGQLPEERWRRVLDPEQPMELGRVCSPMGVPWDSQISRRHALITLSDQELLIQKVESAQNPIFFGGVEKDSFTLKPGEHFVIGKTTFSLTNERVLPTLDVPNPISQRAFSPQFLHNVEYVDADRRIKVLNRLPDVVSSAGNEKELFTQMVNTLLEGISSATTVAIFRPAENSDDSVESIGLNGLNGSKLENQKSVASDSPVDDEAMVRSSIEIAHWDRRRLSAGDFLPSDRLIRQAVESQETILHIWNQTRSGTAEYTMDVDNDWAFVCPLVGHATKGWGIYVTGKNRISNQGVAVGSKSPSASGSGEVDLQGDVKFCELIASTLTNLLEVQQLERRQSSLRPFFSPIVMDAFSDDDPEDVLTPRECEVAVLFCDLRGFSKASEALADNLLELLDRVSKSLGIMTRSILDHGGVIGDFHGDAAMGFWGWPLEQDDRSLRAVNAALEIKQEFASISLDTTHALYDFHMGIGIATGSAVAGKIGTSDQVKVTAFGPVVNLASRLEGMTKWFDSSILIDEETAKSVTSIANVETNSSVSWRLQRLGNFLPYGLKTASQVFRVIPAESPQAASDCLAAYKEAISHFESGQWDQAAQALNAIPLEDPSRKFLQAHMDQVAINGSAPANFGGIIEMSSK